MRLAAAPLKRSTDWVLQLINIVFLCLLFFLVNGTIATQEQREITPPRSLLIESGKPPEDGIYIDASGGVSFRGNRTTVAEIAAILHREASGSAASPPIKVEIVADRSLKAMRLVDVLSELRNLDIATLSLITLRDASH